MNRRAFLAKAGTAATAFLAGAAVPAAVSASAPPTDKAIQDAIQDAIKATLEALPRNKAISSKIDVNDQILRMAKLLEQICNHFGVAVPAVFQTETP